MWRHTNSEDAAEALRQQLTSEGLLRQAAEARCLDLEDRLEAMRAQVQRAEAALLKLSARCAELDQLARSQAESLSIALRLKAEAER
jgi:hypothetical protein